MSRPTTTDAAGSRQQTTGLIFVKLGGSVITDKSRARTPLPDVIERLAQEVALAKADAGIASLVIGHGSGSFGHWVAKKYGTRQGVRTPEQWDGYAQVASAAAELNTLVAHALHRAGLRVVSIRPSKSARCADGVLEYLDIRPVTSAMDCGGVPLVYGDVALDSVRGGTIVSTEDIFVYLADQLKPARILLVGEVEGVLRPDGSVIPTITPRSFPYVRPLLAGSAGVDVTGGMADKVTRMVDLVARHAQTRVDILSGVIPGTLYDALGRLDSSVGTRITED